jgi:hypothetical protein
MTSETREGPAADRTPRPATTAIQAATSIAASADSVDAMLADLRRWERAARLIADDEQLSIKARCKALLELMANARRRDGAAFFERAVWKGCAHFFEEEHTVPRNMINALRRLRHRGLSSCPTCRRDVPDHDELDRWVALRHDYRRPA